MKNRKKNAAELEAELEMTAGHTPESFKKMMEENPELEKEWKEQIEKNRGVVSSLEDKWAGCENLPNEKMQQMCEDKKKDSKEDDKEDGKDKKAQLSEEYFDRSLMTTRTMEAGVSDLFSKPHESVRNFVAEDEEIMAGHTEKSFKEMMKKNPDLEKKWKDQIKENEGVVGKKATQNITSSTEENPMNKTARVALRTLTANWGLTADETYDMLAEDELGEYLSEMEAEMWAEEMEAGGNTSFKPVYKERAKHPNDWFIPNKTNEQRGGDGAGGKGNKNYLYHDYGKARSYAPDYYKRYYKRKKKKPEGIQRRNCPDMKGGKFKCTKTKDEKKKSN